MAGTWWRWAGDAQLAGFAATLRTWAASVTVVTNGRVFEGRRDDLDRLDVELVEERASALLGRRGALRAVRLAGGRELPCGLLFFSVAHTPNAGLARQLGCAVDDEGYLVVNDCNRTTVPGVYAAGDLTPGMQLTQVAAAKGTVAGISAAQSLLELG